MTAPYIADSYVRAEDAVTRIAGLVSLYITHGDDAIDGITKARDNLQNLGSAFPTGFLESVQYINQQATANPTDTVWQDLKNRTDKIVSDYQAARTRLATIVTTIDGL